jgi:hypothetical protein
MEKDTEDFQCKICNDTGLEVVYERVYQNEPHMAPIGTRPCLCTMPDMDEYDNTIEDF